MAKKTYICQGGYLNDGKGKLTFVTKGTEVVIDEKVGDASRLLVKKVDAKKLVVNTEEEK